MTNYPARVGSGVSILGTTTLELVSRMERTPERCETLLAEPTEEYSGGTRRERTIAAVHPAATPAQIDAARIQRTESEGAL